MNKQEAIEKLKAESWEYEDNFCRVVHVIDLDVSQKILSQIHEPQKVAIPQLVAEYIERCKQSGWHLQKVLSRLDDDEKVGDWAYDENDDLISEKVDMVAHAWIFGYEIEQEQLYTVEIPDPNADGYSIILGRIEGKVQIKQVLSTTWKMNCSNQLTEAEIKQDFEWAWDAEFAVPVPVEVE